MIIKWCPLNTIKVIIGAVIGMSNDDKMVSFSAPYYH